MNSHKLKRYVAPPPAPQPVCVCCKTFQPDVQVPCGDGVKPMCWLCAHHVIDHGIHPSEAWEAECDCLPEAVYPESLLQARRKCTAQA